MSNRDKAYVAYVTLPVVPCALALRWLWESPYWLSISVGVLVLYPLVVILLVTFGLDFFGDALDKVSDEGKEPRSERLH